jgi:YebC/PmpR family DNA-binding regulatory protein
MSGHNKWSTIKHKKAAVDAKRGKIFSRLSKELTLSARAGGGDPTANPRLRSAILSAREANMPNDNVKRAIQKGTGELGGQALEELVYEGYATGGIAVLVDALSDNRNRTAAEVRSIFTKANCTLATAGSVARLFSRKARFAIEGADADEEKLMQICFDAGVDVDDIWAENGEAEIIAPPEALDGIVAALEGAGVKVSESGIVKRAETMVPVVDPSVARQIDNLIEALEENDDVQGVSTNADLTDEVMAKLNAE